MARVDRVMGNVIYERTHSNQAGGQAEPNNPLLQVVWKNYTINSTAKYDRLPPPVGRPRSFRSMLRVERGMGDAAYDQRHPNWGEAQVKPNNYLLWFLWKN